MRYSYFVLLGAAVTPKDYLPQVSVLLYLFHCSLCEIQYN